MAEKIELKVGQVWVDPVSPEITREICRIYVSDVHYMRSDGSQGLCFDSTFRAWIRRQNARVQP